MLEIQRAYSEKWLRRDAMTLRARQERGPFVNIKARPRAKQSARLAVLSTFLVAIYSLFKEKIINVIFIQPVLFSFLDWTVLHSLANTLTFVYILHYTFHQCDKR